MPSSILPSPNLNLHALIIGINKYADKSSGSFEDLECAVSDAKSIVNFLETSLHVSSSHILTLFDSAATRSNILSSFASHLLNNDDIKHGDPILVYFAGHGTHYLMRPREREKYDTDDGNYEAICPHDRGCIDPDGKKVRDIRDSTLGKMLLDLSLAKGNNITVILDCCHSGSGTRG
ncbi:uncharacterized protein STEHIDRAFT_56298, partial [Stereum hirsutum FP-91666 SS1]|uniref:uncharacterized protein n=1 Tax=Stereum hirsutum (strain FP-91666) TaxID=721885 RepID=UPI000440F8F9